MSDFQLITGLTIMISGAIQLPSGITAYHWQRVIRIAWFSCITHLCCLTVLREHFKQNRSLYYWRLPGMVIRVIMLAVGFVPTAQYTWDNESDSSGEQEVALRPFPRDYAICYLGFSQGPNQTESTRYSSSQQRMVLSAVLLLFGMLNRIWHLFDKLTTEFLRVRGFTSSFCKDFLRQMRVWSTADAFWSYLVAVFVYRPCLAIYLTVRILMDMITSRAFEVRLGATKSLRILNNPGLVAGPQFCIWCTELMVTQATRRTWWSNMVVWTGACPARPDRACHHSR